MSKKKRNRHGYAQSRNRNKQERMAAQRNTERTHSASTPSAKVFRRTEEASAVVALDPLAPVIVRSGRPFDEQAGPDPARFPPPSTVAGCLRTAWARARDQEFGLQLRNLAVAGPLLLDRGDHVLVPKPANAHYFGTGNAASCTRAEPRSFVAGCDSDLPDGLMPVQLTKRTEGKPGKGPHWWLLSDLLDFRQGQDIALTELTKRGWSPGAGDRRMHVAINRKRGAADEGKLFQTEGLVLDDREADDAAAGGLRLLARFSKPLGLALAHLGGERRLAALDPLDPQDSSIWPAPIPGWLQDITDSGGLCLTLLTPGIFKEGYRPGWLDEKLIGSPPAVPGLTLKLCATAVERWQPHSGWDLAVGQPRLTRKLVPAGSTYWFRILDGADEKNLGSLWLANVSDQEQDRLDGFGLALPSAWQPDAA